ncbi:MAG: DUF1285 domain-containing protein [Pseudomonadota bacterium]
MSGEPDSVKIQGLDSLVRAAADDRLPPVETWDPPHCGDIGLEIRSDGTWFYQGTPIGRLRLVKLFARILRREPDGSYVLVTPVEKIIIKVADAPFLAVEMEIRDAGPKQRLVFRTNLDDIVTVDATHPLRFVADPATAGLKPYVRVRSGLEALVTRALTFDLVDCAVSGPDDGFGVWSSGVWFPLAAQ